MTSRVPGGPLVIALDHRGTVVRPEDGGMLHLVTADRVDEVIRERAEGAVAFLAADTGGDDELETPAGLRVLDTSQGVLAALARASEEAGGLGTFVSADRVQRAEARRAGWASLPHERCVGVPGRGPRFLRVFGAVDPARLSGFVPYAVDHLDGGIEVIGVGDDRTMSSVAAQRCEAQVLDGDPAVDDLVRIHVDHLDDDVLGELARHRVVHQRVTPSGIGVAVVALGPDESVDDLDIHGAHGHLLMLAPRPELTQPATAFTEPTVQVARHVPRELLELVPAVELDLSRLLASWCAPDAVAFQHDVDRYSGAAPLDSSGTISSRHVRHADNARVVAALLADLRSIGYCAWTHTFTFEGTTVRNVLAELPGRGYLVVRPDLELRLRELVLATRRPDRRWCERVLELVGDEVVGRNELAQLDPAELRHRLMDLLELRVWWPWWCRRPAAGRGAQLVIVGCHLDSTAASDGGFDPTSDPAPGADDDASGIAAVLAAARRLWTHRGALTHTVRFAFFNAEEVGLAGSAAYAALLKAGSAPVKAVVCADMIGYNSDLTEIFEIHAGATNAAVRDMSVPIAQRIAAVAGAQGGLGSAQIYQGTSWPPPGSADRTLHDGAIDRSDHASFHAQGYPAVVVSEDFFANLGSEPASDANPNYHRAADQVIDAGYGARIACAVSEAVRQMAQ